MKPLVAVCVLVALVGVLAIDSAPTPPQPRPASRVIQEPRPAAPPTMATPEGEHAEAVTRAYARRSLNWSGGTRRLQQARLAELSAGALRAVHLLGAGDESTASALARQREGSRGRVLELALRRQGQRIHARVLVRERFQGREFRDVGGWHTALYLALLQNRRAGWRVVAWTPQAQTGPTRGEP